MKISAEELVSLSEEAFLEQKVAWIDHRSCEEEVVESVAAQIEENLAPVWKDDELWVSLNEEEFRLPLTISRHDRYVAIGSLSELLKDKYTFWLVKAYLGSDTHGLFITTNELTEELELDHDEWLDKNLELLRRGYDYFGDVEIPYIGNEEKSPDPSKPNREQIEVDANKLKNMFSAKDNETPSAESKGLFESTPFMFIMLAFGAFILLGMLYHFIWGLP